MGFQRSRVCSISERLLRETWLLDELCNHLLIFSKDCNEKSTSRKGGAFLFSSSFCPLETQNLASPKMTQKKRRKLLRLFKGGGTDGNRTSDTRIFSPLLYQLSYGTSVSGRKITTFFVFGNKKSSKRTIFLLSKLFSTDIQLFAELVSEIRQ